jgi:hypothetical protein
MTTLGIFSHARKPGSIVPPHELVTVGKVLHRLRSSGLPSPGSRLSPGKREQKSPIFHLDLDTCPASSLFPPAQGKHEQDAAPVFCAPNRLEPLLYFRMFGIGEHGERPVKQALDRGKRDAVLLAFFPVALVPLKTRNS